MVPDPHTRAAELLAQAGWMRALATALLADPGAADDVVQEACISALRHPPRADRPLEAWLARVVRNLASKRRRSETRRSEHERRAASSEHTSGPEVTAERLELRRTVLAAVEAISEPFRTVLVERYFEGRSSAEIARAQGLPEGTVRWRLKRAVDELRGRLDHEFGERSTWCTLLAPLVAPPRPAAGGSAAGSTDLSPWEPGVLAMVGASKFVLSAVLAVTALGFVLWRRDAESRASSPAVVLSGPVAEEAEAPVVEEPSARASSQREAVPAVEEHPASGREAATEPVQASTTALLEMRFVDPRGAPREGVRVSYPIVEDLVGTSGPDGRVEIRLTPDAGVSQWTVALVARGAGCVTRDLRPVVTAARTTDLGDVLLEPGARVEGRVLDASGDGVAEAEVGLAAVELQEEELGRWFAGLELSAEERKLTALRADEEVTRRRGTGAFERSLMAKSSADGTFVLEGVAAGSWRLWAHGPGTRFGWTEPLEVAAGEDVLGVTVQLPALLENDRITGVVLDPAGRPLASARLAANCQLGNTATSSVHDAGTDGRFELVIGPDAVYSLVASDPELRYADAVLLDVAPGTRDLVLRLGEKRSFEVSVHGREGEALEGCRFVLVTEISGVRAEQRPEASRIEAGVYALPLPVVPFELRADVDGYLPARLERLRPESLAASLEVVLEPAPRLRGRVVAEGKPVAHARVEVHRAVAGRMFVLNGFPCVYEPDPEREVESDAEGGFVLAACGAEPVWLRASGLGWIDGEVGPIDPLSASELTLELGAGGSLEGRVLAPEGASPQGIVVALNHGDGRPRILRVGSDGSYRFENLMAGRWQVVRSETEPDMMTRTVLTSDFPLEIPWSCTVEHGRTTRFDLDLSRP